MRRAHLVLLILAASVTHAAAQEKSPEDRLRDALRQSVEQMRAAQDQAAQAQAQLAAAQQERDAAKAAQAAAEQKLAAAAAKPAAKPEELAAMQAQLRAAATQDEQLRAAIGKMQAAYAQVTEVARGKIAEAAQSSAGLAADTRALATCKAANTRLIGVAEEILHLYQTVGFRSLLLRSYEPVVGFARVKLENLVQDYDDKIHDQEYVPPRAAVR